jgi:hypothetical protein
MCSLSFSSFPLNFYTSTGKLIQKGTRIDSYPTVGRRRPQHTKWEERRERREGDDSLVVLSSFPFVVLSPLSPSLPYSPIPFAFPKDHVRYRRLDCLCGEYGASVGKKTGGEKSDDFDSSTVSILSAEKHQMTSFSFGFALKIHAKTNITVTKSALTLCTTVHMVYKKIARFSQCAQPQPRDE